jgi:hypothetical protein
VTTSTDTSRASWGCAWRVEGVWDCGDDEDSRQRARHVLPMEGDAAHNRVVTGRHGRMEVHFPSLAPRGRKPTEWVMMREWVAMYKQSMQGHP